MIIGVHSLIYAKDAEKARAFFRDVLGFRHVDAGEGWLIFALPPGEVGIHPAMDGEACELYLMCDDVKKTVKDLKEKGVRFTMAPVNRGWGIVTALKIPGGGNLGLYQPLHPLACLPPKRKAGRRPTRARKAVSRAR